MNTRSRSTIAIMKSELGKSPAFVLGRARKWGKGYKKTEIEVPLKLDILNREMRLNAFSSSEAAKAWVPPKQKWKVYRPSDLVSIYGSIYKERETGRHGQRGE